VHINAVNLLEPDGENHDPLVLASVVDSCRNAVVTSTSLVVGKSSPHFDVQLRGRFNRAHFAVKAFVGDRNVGHEHLGDSPVNMRHLLWIGGLVDGL